jgi:hypothetical protein
MTQPVQIQVEEANVREHFARIISTLAGDLAVTRAAFDSAVAQLEETRRELRVATARLTVTPPKAGNEHPDGETRPA